MKLKLAFIAQPEYFRSMYHNVLFDKKWNAQEFTFNYQMKESEFSKLVKYDADYNFFFRGEYIPDEIIKSLKGKTIFFSSEPFPRKINQRWVYTKDSFKRYMLFRNNIRNKSFDYVFHYDNNSQEIFKHDGIQLSGECIFPISIVNEKTAYNKKKWDIFFLGRSSPHREKLFGELKHKYKFLHIAHGISDISEINNYISQSKICINAHSENEIQFEPRMQLLLAGKAFVLSEKLLFNKFIKPGTDYIEFIDKQDLHDKFVYYLDHPIEREKIANHGYKVIKKHYNCNNYFEDIITGINNNKFPRFSTSKPSTTLNILDKVII